MPLEPLGPDQARNDRSRAGITAAEWPGTKDRLGARLGARLAHEVARR